MTGRILVVEDAASWRERLADALRTEGYEVYVATSLEEERQLFYQVKPDVLLLDMQLRAYGYQGWTILDELDDMLNSPEVIVITDQITDRRQLRQMRQGYGVFDIILKNEYEEADFLQTVRDAVEAKRRADAKENVSEPPTGQLTESENDTSCTLTEAEKAVMREVARGKPSKLIAVNRDVTTYTIKTQLGSIFKKLGVTNRIEAIRAARKLGCISGDDDDLM